MGEHTHFLEGPETEGYGPRTLPDPLDGVIGSFLLGLLHSEPMQRHGVEAELCRFPLRSRTLLAYSERMASLAVRTNDADVIMLGLVAAALSRCPDKRDAMLVLPLHYRSAEKVCRDPVAIFRRAADAMGGDGQQWLSAFLQRSAADREIAAMGFEEGTDAQGFRYRSVPDPNGYERLLTLIKRNSSAH